MTGQLTQDEIRVLRPGLQAQLAEEKEAEAARLAGEEARRREAERLVKEAAEEREAAAAYFNAVSHSGLLFAEFLKAEAGIYEKAKAWRAFVGAVPGGKLQAGSIARRNSGYISLGLKTLAGATVGRYGQLVLSQFYGRTGVWLEAERSILGEQET